MSCRTDNTHHTILSAVQQNGLRKGVGRKKRDIARCLWPARNVKVRNILRALPWGDPGTWGHCLCSGHDKRRCQHRATAEAAPAFWRSRLPDYRSSRPSPALSGSDTAWRTWGSHQPDAPSWRNRWPVERTIGPRTPQETTRPFRRARPRFTRELAFTVIANFGGRALPTPPARRGRFP